MAHKRNFRHNRARKPAAPFTGMINQLKREKLILCSLNKFEGFREALIDKDIDYDLGDFFGDAIIVMKK